MKNFTLDQKLELTKILILAFATILLFRINTKLPKAYSTNELREIREESKKENTDYYKDIVHNRKYFYVKISD